MKVIENTLVHGLTDLMKKEPQAAGRAVYEFAQGEVLPVAKERTPVDYGTLRDSGIVDLPVIKEGLGLTLITVAIGFGGGAAHYAIWVHEDLEAKHEVGQAKFLESAMNDKAQEFIEIVGANLARALGM